jgi:hypothetical protein
MACQLSVPSSKSLGECCMMSDAGFAPEEMNGFRMFFEQHFSSVLKFSLVLEHSTISGVAG